MGFSVCSHCTAAVGAPGLHRATGRPPVLLSELGQQVQLRSRPHVPAEMGLRVALPSFPCVSSSGSLLVPATWVVELCVEGKDLFTRSSS